MLKVFTSLQANKNKTLWNLDQYQYCKGQQQLMFRRDRELLNRGLHLSHHWGNPTALPNMIISWVQVVIPRKGSSAMMQRKSSFLVSSKSKLTEIRGQVSIILPSKLLDLVLRQLRLSKERCALISCQSTPAMHNLRAIIRLEKKVHSGQVRLFRSARNVKSLFRRLPALESMTLTGLKVSPNLEFLAQSWASKQDLTTLIHLKSRFTTTSQKPQCHQLSPT